MCFGFKIICIHTKFIANFLLEFFCLYNEAGRNYEAVIMNLSVMLLCVFNSMYSRYVKFDTTSKLSSVDM